MKTELYLSQLLYRYQCVTVPGFGAFLTEIQSAQWHELSNTFYPPKKLISFNSYLKNNDGLLANHMVEAEKISYEKAVLSIENEVAIWKNVLRLEGKIELKNIGEISVNSEGNLLFFPVEKWNYLTSSFGLSPFIAPTIERTNVLKSIDTIEEKEPIVFIAAHRNSRSYLKYAAVFLLSLGATGFIGAKLYQDRIDSETLLVEMAVQKQVQNKIQEATFFIENPLPSVTLTVKEEKMFFHVVAGAFRLEKNAEKVYQELSKEGFKARRMEPNKHGLHPVFYGSYPTYTAAQKARTEIQKTHDEEAWLLIEDL